MMKYLKWQYALLAILIAAGSLITFYEPVRARVLELIKTVAGFNISEQTSSPMDGITASELSATQTSGQLSITPTIYTISTLPLPDALQNPPFQFGMPAWVPEGYTLDENVGIANSNDWVSLIWTNSENSEIEMLVEQKYTGYDIPAGENSSEEIQINGQPALLVRGFWNEQHEWDPQRGISIGWEKEDHFYRLTYSEREPVHNEIKPIEGDMEATLKEMIQMAESIP